MDPLAFSAVGKLIYFSSRSQYAVHDISEEQPGSVRKFVTEKNHGDLLAQNASRMERLALSFGTTSSGDILFRTSLGEYDYPRCFRTTNNGGMKTEDR